MKWWLTLVTTLLLSPSASSSSDGFLVNFRFELAASLKQVTTHDSDSDGGWGDVNQQQSGIKRKMSQAGLNASSDLDFLGINKDVTDFFTMPINNIAASLADISQSRTLPPLHQASTPILGRRIIPEPTSNDSLTSGRMGSSASSVYSVITDTNQALQLRRHCLLHLLAAQTFFQRPVWNSGWFAGDWTFSPFPIVKDGEFIGNTLLRSAQFVHSWILRDPQYPLLGQPKAPIQWVIIFVFSSESASRLRLGQSAADESAEGSSAVSQFDPDDAFDYDYLDNLLNSFDGAIRLPSWRRRRKDAKIKPVLSADSASTASDLLEGLNFDDFPQIPQPQQQPAQQFELSPKARAYSFSDAFCV